MPQIAKGGKFVFGWSEVRDDLSLQLPKMVLDEYQIASENRVILFTGSKAMGGFCVTRKGLLQNSALQNILSENIHLADYKTPQGEFIRYKGRSYCWLDITESGKLQLSENMLKFLSLQCKDKLLSIRGSNIAFVMGVKGPLIKGANQYDGIIELF